MKSKTISEHVRKRGSGFVVTDSSGKKVLGHHKSKKSALRQLRAIEAHKHMHECADEYLDTVSQINKKRMEEARHTWSDPLISQMSEEPMSFGAMFADALTRVSKGRINEDFDDEGKPIDKNAPQKTDRQAVGADAKKREADKLKREREKLMPNEYDNVDDAKKAAGRLGIQGFHTSGVSKYKPGNSEDSLRDAIAKKKEDNPFKTEEIDGQLVRRTSALDYSQLNVGGIPLTMEGKKKRK